MAAFPGFRCMSASEKTKPMKGALMFELFYHVSNNGDGSVSVHFHQTMDRATKADDKAQEGEGWGEASTGSVVLKVDEQGRISFKALKEVLVRGKFKGYKDDWQPLVATVE